MNQPPIVNQPPTVNPLDLSEPVVIDPATVEVLPADAPLGANAAGVVLDETQPAKPAERRSVELGPKACLPGKRTQFYHECKEPARLVGILAPPGLTLAGLIAGTDRYTFEGEGAAPFEEAHPNGVVCDGGGFLTAILRNTTAEEIQGRVAMVLEASKGSGRGGARRTGGARGARAGAAAPSVAPRVGRRAVPSAQGGGNPVRTGPSNRRVVSEAPRRVPGTRTGSSMVAEARRTPNADAHQPTTQMRAVVRRPPGQVTERTAAPVVGETEIVVRVERFRMPALRDFALRGVPIPPGHIGALQNAMRKGDAAPGEPVVLSKELAGRVSEVLSRGARLTREEGAELARRIDDARAPRAAFPVNVAGADAVNTAAAAVLEEPATPAAEPVPEMPAETTSADPA